MNIRRVFKWLVIFLVGLAVGISLWTQIRYQNLSPLFQSISFLVALIFGSGISFFIIKKIIEPRLTILPRKTWLFWLGICLLIGFFLVYAIPITLSTEIHQLKIIATGYEGPLSQGNEVWLASISGGQRTPPQELSRVCQGNWYIRDNMRVFSRKTASELNCAFRIDDDVILVTFGTHAWSGRARLIYGDQVVDVDLFSKESGIKQVKFPNPASQNEVFWRVILFFADGISIGLTMLALSIWFISFNRGKTTDSASKPVRWYWYSLPIVVSWTLTLLVFWPGFLSPDPLYQLEQIVGGHLNDWHPAFHTMTLWLFTRIWFSPAPIIIAQILVLGALVGRGLSRFQQDKASPWITWSAAGFLALSPAISLMILNPWKDTPYAIAITALTLLIFKIVISHGKWIEKPLSWIVLGIAAALTAIYRHNGFPAAIGTLAVLLLSYPKQWRSLLAASLVGLALWAGIRGPLYRIVGVETASEALGSNLGVEAKVISLIDWHSRSGTPFHSEEKHLLSEIEDLQSLAAQSSELNLLAVRLTFRNPLSTLEWLSSIYDYILQIRQPPNDRVGYVELSVYDNPFGIKPDSKLLRFQPKLIRATQLTETPDWDWLFWRNASWMYLLCWAALVACTRRKSWRYFLLTIPILLNALPLPLGSGGQISRYILATLLVSPLFSGYLLTISPSQDQLNHIE